MYIVGTPKKRVALQRSIARATTTGLKRCMSSRVAPANRGTFITPASPPAWNSGSADTTVSSPSAIWNHVANWIVFATRLACVSMAPFGVPVVPPVYMSNARSACGSTGDGSWGSSSSGWRSDNTGIPRRVATAPAIGRLRPVARRTPACASATWRASSGSDAIESHATAVAPSSQVA